MTGELPDCIISESTILRFTAAPTQFISADTSLASLEECVFVH